MMTKETIRKFDETLVELIAGIALYGLVVEIAGVIFSKDLLSFSIGLVCGCLAAGFMAFHMYRSISNVLMLEEKDAVNATRSSAVLRYLVVVGGFFVLYFTEIGSPFSYVIGVFGLKAAAYLQPFLKKIYKKVMGTGEEP